VIGISALTAIAGNWAWLRRTALWAGRQIAGKTAGLTGQAEERKLVIWLLFAFAYVFATASSVSLFHDRSWVHDFGSWIVLGFGMMYAVLYGVLESKRGCCAGPTRRTRSRLPLRRIWGDCLPPAASGCGSWDFGAATQ